MPSAWSCIQRGDVGGGITAASTRGGSVAKRQATSGESGGSAITSALIFGLIARGVSGRGGLRKVVIISPHRTATGASP